MYVFKILNVVIMEDAQPTLCEPGVKYFIGCSLKESHKFKEQYMNLLQHWYVCFVFGSIAAILMCRYKGHITPQELALKNRKKREYIIQKLQHLASIKEQNNKHMITNLPTWENNPETEMLKKYL